MRVQLTQESRLERWLGKAESDRLRTASVGVMTQVPIGNVPGDLFTYDGQVYGVMKGGGFASLSDLISEATTGGKRQQLTYVKAGTAGVAGRSNSLWAVGGVPPIGAAGGTSGTGAARTSATTGALKHINAAGGDTLHLVGAVSQASVATNLLLVYDRLWDMTHTMTVDPRSCDAANVPTRYQTAALAPGNF